MQRNAHNVQQAQNQFREVMPHVQRIAGYAFRHRDPESSEDAVAEAVAHAWKNHLHCSLNGKTPGAPSIAYYAVQNVKSGRRFAAPAPPTSTRTAPRSSVVPPYPIRAASPMNPAMAQPLR